MNEFSHTFSFALKTKDKESFPLQSTGHLLVTHTPHYCVCAVWDLCMLFFGWFVCVFVYLFAA